MQPTIGRIEQLTHTPCPPIGGSGVPNKIVIPIELDTSTLDEAQKKADKLKATLVEINDLINKTNLPNNSFSELEKAFEEISKDYLMRQKQIADLKERERKKMHAWS